MINSTNIPRAYSEVYAFMNTIGQEYINKVPKRIYEKIRNNRDKSYNPIYNKNQTMTKDSISKEALSLIAGLNLQYWCEDEKEKQRLKNIYAQNEQKYQEELREKYNPDNIFKKNNNQEQVENKIEEPKQLVEYKESAIKKFFEKVLRILHIRK